MPERKGNPTGCICPDCYGEFHDLGGMTTLVGYCQMNPEKYIGHYHDDNCTSRTFRCECKELRFNPRNECAMCDWTGRDFCNIGHGPDGIHFTPLKDMPYGLGAYIKKIKIEEALADYKNSLEMQKRYNERKNKL